MAEHDEHERALDRFWDVLVAGSPPPSADDPPGAETIRRFHAVRDVPGADPAFWARLEEDLMHAEVIITPASAAPTSLAHPRAQSAGRLERPSIASVSATRRRLAIAQVAIAAAILLLIAFGARARWDDGQLFGIPAPDAPSTSPPGVTEQTVFVFGFDIDELPRGDVITSLLIHHSIPPGARSTWRPICCRGPLVEFVAAGVYTIRVEAPIRVVRADGSLEEVPVGVEVVLRPGDSLVSRTEVAFEAANDGATPVELVSWAVMDDPDAINRGPELPGWTAHDFDADFNLEPAAGPAILRLRLIELALGAGLPTTPGAVEMAIRFDPALAPAFGLAGAPSRNEGAEPLTVYLASLEVERLGAPRAADG